MSPFQHSHIIKQTARKLGFDFCGLSKAEFLEHEAPKLDKFLKLNYHGEMHYLENYFDKRLDPTLLHPGTKTVVSLMLNYYPTQQQIDHTYKVAKYAYGDDYHEVIKNKCNILIKELEQQIGQINARCFVDSAPILERVWAEKSGLGWVGKNGLIINPKQGSFFFLAEILIDIDCEYDGPIKDYCGTCNKCVDACPTDAILPNKTLNAQKCISYLTIELKNEISSEFKNKTEDWIFGCDICQDVCPWNRFSKTNTNQEFEPIGGVLNFTKKDWEALEQEEFQRLFKKSAIKRTKFAGLKRNINFNKIKS
ncbi:MAG: tRNA epoxyqueuosine(34) reductase QueG [Bacteroidota bacterium]|nr:tRNA epoxyqueuosine(34) reductase QueG [Bacteroidota bacterium]